MNAPCRNQDQSSSDRFNPSFLPREMKQAAARLGQGHCPEKASRNSALALLRLQLQMNQRARENWALRSRGDDWL